VTGLSDEALADLLRADPERGWRAFVEEHTATLLALIRRAGVVDEDDAAEIYVRVCQRLAENECARLRRHDPSKGALAAWLTIVVRRVIVDWVRSREGRRRLFRSVRRLSEFDQKVFELRFWEGLKASEIAERIGAARGRPADLADVLEGLERISDVLSDRHQSQLAAIVGRSRPALSFDAPVRGAPLDLLDARSDPEAAAQERELEAIFASALSALSPEDAAIVRLMFGRGWSRAEVERSLHLAELSPSRVKEILARLRAWLEAKGVGPGEAATPGLKFLEERSS